MLELSKARVLAVDDSAFWREMMARLLKSSVQHVWTAADGHEAVQKAVALRPDVIMMDMWMPALSGLEAIREIRAFAPESTFLMVTNERDPDMVEAALAAGAHGYVLKSQAGTDLLPALESLVRGGLFIGRGVRRFDGDGACRNPVGGS
jgi:DNA-binding NarL/FixJ family response regulator